MIIRLEDDSFPIQENVRRATIIDKPEHIEIAAQLFEDRIEFRAYNTETRYGEMATFYFNNTITPGYEETVKSHLIKTIIKNVLASQSE